MAFFSKKSPNKQASIQDWDHPLFYRGHFSGGWDMSLWGAFFFENIFAKIQKHLLIAKKCVLLQNRKTVTINHKQLKI